MIDSLLENPLIPAAAGGLLALLGGLAFYRVRQRRATGVTDSSFLESRLQPDSFFGASGGQKVDTNESSTEGTSMMYSPSQLDAAGDVDPVAEADVYLAYGRDLQAEEILKEALRTAPTRVALHAKLLEIYAKRHDVKAFEHMATEAYQLTEGKGPVWQHICELGQALDRENPLYKPGGHPPVASSPTQPLNAFAATTVVQGADSGTGTAGALDLDLDLDFSVDAPAAPPAESTQALEFTTEPQADEPTVALEAPPPEPDMGLSFDLPLDAQAAPVAVEEPTPDFDLPALDMAMDVVEPEAAIAVAQEDSNGLAFDLGFDTPAPSSAAPVVESAEQVDDGLNLNFDLPLNTTEAAAPAPLPDNAASFDLDGLSLDLGEAPTTESPALDAASLTLPDDDLPDDPLATKLALAEEFHAIGDDEGARSLAEEVMAEATGNLKIRAQRFLGGLG